MLHGWQRLTGMQLPPTFIGVTESILRVPAEFLLNRLPGFIASTKFRQGDRSEITATGMFSVVGQSGFCRLEAGLPELLRCFDTRQDREVIRIRRFQTQRLVDGMTGFDHPVPEPHHLSQSIVREGVIRGGDNRLPCFVGGGVPCFTIRQAQCKECMSRRIA